MTTHDDLCVACRPRSPHVVTFREVWAEDFAPWERLVAIPAVVAVVIVIVAVLAVVLR